MLKVELIRTVEGTGVGIREEDCGVWYMRKGKDRDSIY